MPSLKKPQVIVHALFGEYSCDAEEIAHCIFSFLDGDCGSLENEGEVLGFMDRSIKGELHHGVYETHSAGKVHVVGDNEKIMAFPDIIYASSMKDLECSINTCSCNKHSLPTPQPNNPS